MADPERSGSIDRRDHRGADQKEPVQKKCGEPVARERVCEAGPLINGVAACVNVERWTYRPEYDRFVTTLGFAEAGTLAEISYGDRR